MTTHTCPCCGNEMDAQIQTFPARFNKPDLTLLTCRNAECAIYDYTRTPEDLAGLLSELGVNGGHRLFDSQNG